MYNTFRQGVFLVKKTLDLCVRRIDFLDSIQSRSVAELKITSIGHGVSELGLGRFVFLNLNVCRILTDSDGLFQILR